MKSTTKSMGGLALLLGLDEGKVALTDKAIDRLPVFGTDPLVTPGTGLTTANLNNTTVLQLATHTSGLSNRTWPAARRVRARLRSGHTLGVFRSGPQLARGCCRRRPTTAISRT